VKRRGAEEEEEGSAWELLAQVPKMSRPAGEMPEPESETDMLSSSGVHDRQMRMAEEPASRALRVSSSAH
jgi:hypothetical protein